MTAATVVAVEGAKITRSSLTWKRLNSRLSFGFFVFKGKTGDEELIVTKSSLSKPIDYQSLLRFLWEDKTDQLPYGKIHCLDFASKLHNQAQIKNIESRLIILDLSPRTPGHALIEFPTSDAGLVYIDPTSPIVGVRGDKQISTIAVGEPYRLKLIFDPGYRIPDMGIINEVKGVI